LSASKSVPCGTFISSTMIVMMMATTPSLNASSRFLSMRAEHSGISGMSQRRMRE
jgi:hypothetical protein